MIAEGPLDAIRLGAISVGNPPQTVRPYVTLAVGDFVLSPKAHPERGSGKVLKIVDSPIGARPLLLVEWAHHPPCLIHHSLVVKVDLITAVGAL